MYNRMIHIPWSFNKFACVCFLQVLVGWKLIFEYMVQWSRYMYIVQWKAVVCWPSAVWCIVSKYQLPPIRICLMHAQIRGMTIGHSIALHRCRCFSQPFNSGLGKYWKLNRSSRWRHYLTNFHRKKNWYLSRKLMTINEVLWINPDFRTMVVRYCVWWPEFLVSNILRCSATHVKANTRLERVRR